MAVLGALLLWSAAAVSVPATAQDHPKPKRIVKEERADGSLVLDESGLTEGFRVMKQMIRAVDTEKIGDAEVEVHSGRLPIQSLDYRTFEELASSGEPGIVQFQAVAAIKLRTEAKLRFRSPDGKTVEVGPGNVADGYPGLYSLWLERTESGDWLLHFNHEADAWGTMYDPAKNAGTAALGHRVDENTKSALKIEIEERGDKGGPNGWKLELAWGGHRWTSYFDAG